jgi:4'-phosphopantetheinyl transferase
MVGMFEQVDVLVLFCFVPKSCHLLHALSERLSEDERAKAARFIFDKDRRLYATAHALMRHSLWRATGRTDTQFSVNKFGKPEILEAGGGPAMKFNISHSGELAVCCLSPRFDVGVDVEEVDESQSFEEVAATQFTPYERARLTACSGPTRTHAFFQLWTLKEALVKAFGHGLQGMDQYSFDLDPPYLAEVMNPDEAPGVHVEQRQLTSSYWASLAVLRPPDISIAVEWRCVPANQIARGFRE